MNRKLLFSFILTMLLAATQVFAQDRTISGRVTDESGQPVPGATVVVKGNTSINTVTGDDGRYTLVVPAGATVIVSFLGQQKEVVVGNNSTLDVSLSDKQLKEVVVTGYTIQERRELTGAISSIKGDVIENLPLQSFDRALQGRVSGVLVQSNNGVPGGGVTVRVRGTGSILAGNDPLYIVDGVQINNRSDAAFLSSNPLGFLNPNDIESIEVLKDAAAGSIYGAQAANGVVLVTTKKGKAGKTVFNLNYFLGIVEPIRQIDVLNSQQYATARMEALGNAGNFTPVTAYLNETNFFQQRAVGSPDRINRDPSYNWQNEMFRIGVINNYELSASGGSDKFSYRVSGSYNEQSASTRNSDFQRLTGNINIGYQASDKLKLESGINLSSVRQTGGLAGADGGSFIGESNFSAPLILPFNPVRLEDGSFFGLAPVGMPGILGQNVAAVVDFNINENSTNQVVANFKGTYRFTPNLTYIGTFGVDYRITEGDRYLDPRTADGFNRRGLLQSTRENNTNWLTNHVLNYTQTFNEDHTVSGLFGIEYREEVYQGINLSADFFPTPQFNTANAAANPLSTGSFWTSFRRAGTFVNAKYDYKKKYFASVVARYDGSSRFGVNNRYGFFPSISAGWLLSEEDFLKDVSFLRELKLRASYGVTGNDQIGNFDARGLYGAIGNYGGFAGIRPSNLENRDLRWERNQTANIGIDYALFNGRIYGSFDIFERTTNDLLLARPLPVTNGFGSFTSNVGQLKNRGLEIEINSINVDKGAFKWATNFNITFIDNEVTRLFDDNQVLPGNNSIRIGQPVGTIVTTRYMGVNPATGRPMFQDRFGNLIYQPVFARDAQIVGNTFAEIFGGFTNTLSYKGIELSAFFQYEFGRDASNGQGSFMGENGGRPFNTEQRIFDNRWTTPGQITSTPRPFNGNTEPNGVSPVGGSRFVEDASYIRLKQLTLAYTLPRELVSRAKLANVRVYAQSLNLLTFTRWQGFDPEFVGGNAGTVPQARNYTFGLQIGF
jgi:TonB-linked SusC/RagA family outer membrane protein